jgi:hypothetical protein
MSGITFFNGLLITRLNCHDKNMVTNMYLQLLLTWRLLLSEMD